MAHRNVQTLCITDRDCARNEEFAELMAIAPNGRMVDFYTFDMDDLSIIAKHRVLPVPTILVLNNNKVICRIVHPPKAELLAELLQNLSSLLK